MRAELGAGAESDAAVVERALNATSLGTDRTSTQRLLFAPPKTCSFAGLRRKPSSGLEPETFLTMEILERLRRTRPIASMLGEMLGDRPLGRASRSRVVRCFSDRSLEHSRRVFGTFRECPNRTTPSELAAADRRGPRCTSDFRSRSPSRTQIRTRVPPQDAQRSSARHPTARDPLAPIAVAGAGDIVLLLSSIEPRGSVAACVRRRRLVARPS